MSRNHLSKNYQGQNASLSIIIPCYNEEKRLGKSFDKLLDLLDKEKGIRFEIIFVDDGSTDGTYNLLKKFSTLRKEVSIIRNEQNRGKGYSIKRGVQQAAGKYVMYIDADLSYDLEAIDRAMDLFDQQQCDLIIGDRELEESESVVDYPVSRKVSGKVLSGLISNFVLKGFKDTQCGLKFFKTEVARKIFELVTIPGFGFDIEVLMIATVNNLRIVKLPVILHHSSNSTVRVFGDSMRILANIFTIICNKHRKEYKFQ
jgi:dolichyl-phosphate beta-glucosyltransferase